MRVVHEVLQVLVHAGRRLDELVVGQLEDAHLGFPRLGQHFGIFGNRLVLNGVAHAVQSLADPQVEGVECAVIRQPAVVVELIRVDDQRVTFPVTMESPR